MLVMQAKRWREAEVDVHTSELRRLNEANERLQAEAGVLRGELGAARRVAEGAASQQATLLRFLVERRQEERAARRPPSAFIRYFLVSQSLPERASCLERLLVGVNRVMCAQCVRRARLTPSFCDLR